MAMLDLQRRHATVFRIRLGDKAGNRPQKLTEQIRITSPNQQVPEAFTDIYGGDVTPWEGQWQAYLPTTELRIVLLPGQAFDQWWERYRGSVCERRCDGFQEQKSGKRCMCPEDPEVRTADKNACSPTTRVNVLCPDVAVVGAGQLVTHGLIAAETLPQSIAVAESALARGYRVPAVLRVVEHKGRNHFIVPQIEIVGVSLNALASGDAAAAGELQHSTRSPEAVKALAAPAAPLTPVPAAVEPGPSVQEQVASAAEPKAKAKRRNAAAPVPRTGIRPRTAAQARAGEPAPRGDDPQTDPDSGAGWTQRIRDGEPPPPDAPPDERPAEPPRDPGKPINADQVTKVVVTCKETGLDDDGRHDLVLIVTDGRTFSSKDLTKTEMDQLLVVCEFIQAERMSLVSDGPNGDPVLLKSDGEPVALPLDLVLAEKWLDAHWRNREQT